MGMGWIDRKFLLDMTDDELFLEAVHKLDTEKISYEYRPIIAVEFPTDTSLVFFRLSQTDTTEMVFPVGSRTVFVEGDERATEIREWIDEHAADGEMSVVANGVISFADRETMHCFKAVIAENVERFVKPPLLCRPEAT